MLNSRPAALHGDGASSLAYARTPARGLLKNHGLRQENAIYVDGLAGTAKGKASLLQTPFRPGTTAGKGMLAGKSQPVPSRPLGDKTPFPNRQLPLQTPAPQKGKLGKLGMMDPAFAKTPGALLLPSARRKSLRLPRSASKKFKTPAQQGRHWDVSDGEIDADMSTGSVEQAQVEEADYDEVEYMPPKVPEQPYEPPFDMPDYNESGKTLLKIAHSYLMDDTQDIYYSTDIEVQIDVDQLLKDSGGFTVEELPLPEIEEDDFTFSLLKKVVEQPETTTSMPKSTRTTQTSTRIDPPLPSRPMTRAASKLQAAGAAPRVPTPITRATRSSSRLAGSSRGRGTPSSERSTASSRPESSTGLRQVTATSRTSSKASSRDASHRTPANEGLMISFRDDLEDDFEFKV